MITPVRQEEAAAHGLVDAVDVETFTIPTDAPGSDATLTWDSTTLVLVKVHSGNVTGLGYTYGHEAIGVVIARTLAQVIEGRSANDIIGSYHAMRTAVRNNGQAGLTAMAISAIDMALWDLKARLLKLPLASLLGQARQSVPIYASGGFTSYTDRQLARQLEGWVEQDIARVKIKVGREPEHDVHRLMVARRAVWPAPGNLIQCE